MRLSIVEGLGPVPPIPRTVGTRYNRRGRPDRLSERSGTRRPSTVARRPRGFALGTPKPDPDRRPVQSNANCRTHSDASPEGITDNPVDRRSDVSGHAATDAGPLARDTPRHATSANRSESDT